VDTHEEGAMKIVLACAVVVAVGFTLGLSGAADAAGLDFERFKSFIGRHAIEPDDAIDLEKPRGACVCFDGSSINGMAGVIYRFESGPFTDRVINVGCLVPTFHMSSGIKQNHTSCSGLFVPLAK
jgi:hypothetical protein